MEARADMEEGTMEDEMAEQEELESRVSGDRGLGSFTQSSTETETFHDMISIT